MTNLRLGTANELIKDRRAVHNFRRSRFKGLRDLARDESFTTPRWAVQQHSTNVINPHLLEEGRGEDARLKRAAKDHLQAHTINK